MAASLIRIRDDSKSEQQFVEIPPKAREKDRPGSAGTGRQQKVAVQDDSEESWQTDLGFRAWYNFQMGSVGVRPFVRAAWEHEYKESRLPITAQLSASCCYPSPVFK